MASQLFKLRLRQALVCAKRAFFTKNDKAVVFNDPELKFSHLSAIEIGTATNIKIYSQTKLADFTGLARRGGGFHFTSLKDLKADISYGFDLQTALADCNLTDFNRFILLDPNYGSTEKPNDPMRILRVRTEIRTFMDALNKSGASGEAYIAATGKDFVYWCMHEEAELANLRVLEIPEVTSTGNLILNPVDVNAKGKHLRLFISRFKVAPPPKK